MLGTKTLKEGEFRTGYLFFDSMHTAVRERSRVLREQSENKDNEHELNIHFSKRPQDQATTPPPIYRPMIQRDPYAEYYYDQRGNPATSALFVDCLPPHVDEDSIFRKFDAFSPTAVKIGTKELRDNEFRTCVIHFATMEQAMQARLKLNGAPFDENWRKPMVINFRSIVPKVARQGTKRKH
jgi:hypothetical protein